MTHPRFFGYGSLVNCATHDFPDPKPATVTGWRRVWQHAAARPVAFLSVEPCPKTMLHGLTAQVPNNDWAALDQREHAYLRHDVSDQFNGHPTAIYQANPIHIAQPSTSHPILLSYLDVVIAGYDALMPDGAAHFFATTTGWGPILNDRDDPLYPRAQPLKAKTRDNVDKALSALGVSVLTGKVARVAADAIRASANNRHNP